ncbi:MAG: response regulator transcription factor [Chloroflexi bacterium]|nr:response regulator transcription factor [Chloroflexota bacterium]
MDGLRIMIVEDHQIVREGLRRMLELEPSMSVVAEAGNAAEAVEQLRATKPDIILMDIQLPGMDGIQLTRRLLEEDPNAHILILTLYDEYLTAAIEAGAVGYLRKDLRQSELIAAIKTVYEGRSPIYLNLDRDKLSNFSKSQVSQSSFTEREMDVLRLLTGGRKDKEMAEELAFSEATIKRTLKSVYEKLGARNRAEAIAETMKHHIT